MGLTVAVQDSLPEIKIMLEQGGFHVVSMEHSREPVSAVVYSGVAETWEPIPSLENYSGVDPIGRDGAMGVVLVNATGFTTQEVVKLVSHRLAGEDY
ncbi:MAG: YkuS family protein [Clostridia bacterium]|nr:YkuS family protein [Clostridia bacterium]